MNLPNTTEKWATWSAQLPRPVLRAEARSRSLQAALQRGMGLQPINPEPAAISKAPVNQVLTVIPPSTSTVHGLQARATVTAKPTRRKLLNFHTMSWAACWIISLTLWLTGPASTSDDASGATGAFGGAFADSHRPYPYPQRMQDPAMEKLLAAIYPNQSRFLGSFNPLAR